MRTEPGSCRTRTPRGRAPGVSWVRRATGCAIGHGKVAGRPAGARAVDGAYRLYSNSSCYRLAGTERDDASDGIVRRDADGDSIARNNFDTETAHTAAELGQHFVAGVTLHAVKPSAMHGHDGALHIDQIVLAQLLANPFI
jgi:hypothetical protein